MRHVCTVASYLVCLQEYLLLVPVMVLVVLRVRDGVKMLKPWYACNVPETATVADVFSELSSGLLDGSNPLPEEYRTTSVEAIIGRSPSTLETRVSCSTKVSDVVSCLGNYIEYVVSITHEALGSTSELGNKGKVILSVLLFNMSCILVTIVVCNYFVFVLNNFLKSSIKCMCLLYPTVVLCVCIIFFSVYLFTVQLALAFLY